MGFGINRIPPRKNCSGAMESTGTADHARSKGPGMSKSTQNYLYTATIITLTIGTTLFAALFLIHSGLFSRSQTSPLDLTPWASIGGCGASSGSVSMDMQLKWIGKGVPGALLDAEVLYMNAVVSDSAYQSRDAFDGHLRLRSNALLLNLFFHPRNADLKLSLPLVMKQGYNMMTGPLGDMSLDLSKRWGAVGNVRTGLTLGLPTGRYRIQTSESICQPEMQLGAGLFTAGGRIDCTIDRDWGLITLGGSYSGGFFGVMTRSWKYDTVISRPMSDKRQLRYARHFSHWPSGKTSGWGAVNDEGAVLPDVASAFVDIGIKTESIVHGISLSYSLPTCDGQFEERINTISNWSAEDPSQNENYVPTRELAQQRADTSSDYTGRNPRVVAADNAGRWIVQERTPHKRPALPALNLQYSFEKCDMSIPLLFGAGVRFDYAKGYRFSGFGAGLGAKFRIY
jgi:hypothetical protein